MTFHPHEDDGWMALGQSCMTKASRPGLEAESAVLWFDEAGSESTRELASYFHIITRGETSISLPSRMSKSARIDDSIWV